MLMVVVAVVGVISLTSLALAQVAATRLDQARNEAIATITPKFASDRMVRDYAELAYGSLLEAMVAPAGRV